MGGVPRYFSKVLRPGIDVTLLRFLTIWQQTSSKKRIEWTLQRIWNENSAQSFSDQNFWKSLRVVDVRAFGSWMSAPKCLFFFQDFEGPDRSFGPGYPREWPPDVRGISVPKTSSLGWFFVPERTHRFYMALHINLVRGPGEFRGNAGFSWKLGVWGGFGRFGVSKGFRKKTTSHATKRGGTQKKQQKRTKRFASKTATESALAELSVA